MSKYVKLQLPIYANNNDAYVPEVWAQESLAILEENMVAANLVHRDFENEIRQFGDVVNTRRPGTFVAKRKTDTDDVTDQDATATNVQVPLDQHLHVTFIIKDGEESKGFKPLVTEYLKPAVLAIGQQMDRIVLTQCYQFLGNSVGKLDTAPTVSTVIALREKLNTNLCPLDGRNLIVSPDGEGALLGMSEFRDAEKVGDAGTAMREASLGRRMGFNIFMCQNTPSFVANASNKSAATVAAAAAAGATSITLGTEIADSTLTATIGSFLTVAGDMTPQQITDFTEGSNVATIYPGLAYAVENGAAVTIYDWFEVAATYAAGYNKPLTVDGMGAAPAVGQMVVTGTPGSAAVKYGLLAPASATSLVLDRSLVAGLTDTDNMFLGPQGDYNFAFHKNAIALVTRPLATPMAGTGALSYVASYNGLGIRVTITYDGKAQGHRVTVDLLAGVKVLDTNLGAVMFS